MLHRLSSRLLGLCVTGAAICACACRQPALPRSSSCPRFWQRTWRRRNRVLTQLRDGGVNPRLEILGVVMTMYDGRTKLSQEVVSEVRGLLGDRVFETLIPRNTKLAEAPSFGKPIIHYDSYSAGAAAYEVFAQEFLARLNKQ